MGQMLHPEPENLFTLQKTAPQQEVESLENKNNTFTLYASFWEDNCLFGDLFASTRTRRAVCIPWAPAVAKVPLAHVTS